MTNEQIANEIMRYAKIYQENLENKNVMFIFQNKDTNTIEELETTYYPRNFLHLTGVDINRVLIKGSIDFYNLAVSNKLKSSHFTVDKNKRVLDKLEAFKQTMFIHKSARQIGDFKGTAGILYTEKLSGNVKACLGFRLDDTLYIPDTNLLGDVRNFILKLNKNQNNSIIIILRKDIKDEKYNEITHIKKGLDLSTLKIPPNIKKLMSIKAMNELKIDFEDSIKLEDFEISRILNDENKLYYAEVSINGESGKYEILHGEDNTSIKTVCEDFGISARLARLILDKADEMEVTHQEVIQESPEEDNEFAPNKDPPENETELNDVQDFVF